MAHRLGMTDTHPQAGAAALMTPAELADYVSIPVGTLYQWRSRKVGPKGIRVGRHLRYRRSDVDSWLDNRTTVE